MNRNNKTKTENTSIVEGVEKLELQQKSCENTPEESKMVQILCKTVRPFRQNTRWLISSPPGYMSYQSTATHRTYTLMFTGA